MARTSTKTKSTKGGRPRKATAEVIDLDEITQPLRWPAKLYCNDTGTGVLILTDEQALALATAVSVALTHARPKAGTPSETHLLSAVEALDHTFSLGIGQCCCDCDCDCEDD